MAVALLAATATLCLALALVGAAGGLPFLIPALLLAAPLATGLYVGEGTLLAIAGRGPANHRAPARSAPAHPAERRVSRGADLIATSLAKRPPPGLAAA